MSMLKVRSFLEKKIPVIVLALLAIQPVLDVFSYFLSLTGSNTLSTLLRFFMLAAVALLGFIISDRKKAYFVIYGVMAVFWVLHAANCFRIGYKSAVEDATNFLRIMNFPIFTLSFMTFFEKGEKVGKSLFLGFALCFGEIVLFTALPWILGTPVYTYEFLQVGVLGWFSVPSAQSAIIILVVPMAVYWAYSTRKYLPFILTLLISFSLMYVTGTKFTFYSMFIFAAGFSFLFAVNLKKKCLPYVLPLIILALAVFLLRGVSPMQIRENMSAYAAGNYGKLVDDSLENSGADEEVISVIKKGVDKESASEDLLEKIRRSLLGVYTDKAVYGSFLKDLHDRFGVYTVMEAYDYTTEPTILSDSRVRKQIFAKLIWEEKDAVTKLLGFEYSDMLTETSIYDLENDFPAVFYFCGYLGFALYLLIFLFFAFVILRKFIGDIALSKRLTDERTGKKTLWIKALWKGLERFMTIEVGAVGITFIMAILTAQISGNVLRRPNVTVYFAAAAACIYYLCAGLRKKKIKKSEEPHVDKQDRLM